MKILVEPSDYVLRNVGDVAMLTVAVNRLKSEFSGARICVLTDEPVALKKRIDAATPHSSIGRRAFLEAALFPSLPTRLRWRLERQVRLRAPMFARMLASRSVRDEGMLQHIREFHELVADADGLVVTGMGGVTDFFPEYATSLLETLIQAGERQRYIAMVGQGIGPLENRDLRQMAKVAFRRVNLFALREGVFGPNILGELGVPASNIICTGDDAIEDAYQFRNDRLGEDVGLNFRLSDYSSVQDADAGWIASTAANFANGMHANVLPIPISFVPGEADEQTHATLHDDNFERFSELPDVRTLLARIVRCRMVVTGSYHAAVFALSCGIPCIGFSSSEYYAFKFEGLVGQFGGGCVHLNLKLPDWKSKFVADQSRLWTTAPDLRPQLLDAAESQIALSRRAYERLAAEIKGGAQRGI